MMKRLLGMSFVLLVLFLAAFAVTSFWNIEKPKSSNEDFANRARCDFIAARLFEGYNSIIDNFDRATVDIEASSQSNLDVKWLKTDAQQVRFVVVTDRKLLISEYSNFLFDYNVDDFVNFFNLAPKKSSGQTEFEIDCDTNTATIMFPEDAPPRFRIVLTYWG